MHAPCIFYIGEFAYRASWASRSWADESIRRFGNSIYFVAAEVETVLRGLFDFAMGRRLIYSHPCTGIKLQATLAQRPAVRPRVALTDAELSNFLAELDASMTKRNALIVKLLLYTGTRIGGPPQPIGRGWILRALSGLCRQTRRRTEGAHDSTGRRGAGLSRRV